MQKYLFHLIAKFHSVFLALFLDFFPMSCANDATFTQHFHLLCLLVCMCALHVRSVSLGPLGSWYLCFFVYSLHVVSGCMYCN